MSAQHRRTGSRSPRLAALTGALLCLASGAFALPAAASAPAGRLQPDLPSDADTVVIHLIEDVGPLAPEYQEGYEIAITAGGEATYTITPVGSRSDEGDAALDEVVLETELSEDALEDLLEELEDGGYFELAEEAETEDDQPVGGALSLLDVTLADDSYKVYGDGLSPEQALTLVEAHQSVVAAVLRALGEAAEAEDDDFELPDEDEVVIEALVSNGPVDPEGQTWYEIEIDADGAVRTEYTPEGASPDLSEPTAEQVRGRYDLEEEGLHGLLLVLDALGFFDLPPTDEGDLPDGGGVDLIRVTLADESWEVYGNLLDGEEAARFAAVQTAIGAAAAIDQFPIALF